jgi:methionyl-tRNA formyltransferase
VKVAFLGTPACGLPSLEALLAAGHRVTLVVTQPDRPTGRSGVPQAPPVKRLALERGIPVAQPSKVRTPAFVDTLAAESPEILVVVAYGRILPRPVLDLAPRGAINVHFSLLPRYRGAAPVQWALARGEKVTGVTTMQISEELDAGGILLQRAVPIEPGEHAPQLLDRLARLGSALLVETLELLEHGTLGATPQDPSQATCAPALSPSDGEADLTLPAGELEGRIRGFDPWPGVWARRSGRRIRLVDGVALSLAPGAGPPGRVLGLTEAGLVIACGEGSCLGVRRLQAEGRRVIDAKDAMNGRVLVPGDQLECRAPS